MSEDYDIIYLEVVEDPPAGYEDERSWSVDADFIEHTKYLRYDLYRDLQIENNKLREAVQDYRDVHQQKEWVDYFLKYQRINADTSIDCGCGLCENADTILKQEIK